MNYGREGFGNTGKLFVVTGVSSGLGLELCRLLLEQGNGVVGLGRRKPAELEAWPFFRFVRLDLENTSELEGLWVELCSPWSLPDVFPGGVTLVNNSAVLDPVGPLKHMKGVDVSRHLAVNLVAPLLLTSGFLQLTAQYSFPKAVYNITSGAALRGKAGWTAYCASKAALNRWTESLALEQSLEQYPVLVFAIDPGIMDTPMQEQIRSYQPSEFPLVEQFKGYKEEGGLLQPRLVAQRVLQIFLEAPLGRWAPGTVVIASEI